MPTRVDVLVPCYNYGRYLESAVLSVLNGGARDVRVLIIDDASTDETSSVGPSLANRFGTVDYRRHAQNAGHHDTYNEGLRWAASPYFLMLSADDLVAPGALGRAASFLDGHPEVGLVFGRTRQFRGSPPAGDGRQSGFSATQIDGLEFIRAASGHGYNPIDCPASVMVRTDLQHAIGGYRPELPCSGDLEMWLRFAARAHVGFLDIDQGLYRRHDDNMSLSYRHLRDYEQRWLAWKLFCKDHEGCIAEHDTLLHRVESALASEIFEAAQGAFEAGDPIDVGGFARMAARLDPALSRSPAFRKFALKRLLGRRLSAVGSRVRSRLLPAVSA